MGTIKIYLEDDNGEKQYIEADKFMGAMQAGKTTDAFRPVEVIKAGDVNVSESLSYLEAQLTDFITNLRAAGVPLAKIQDLTGFMVRKSFESAQSQEQRLREWKEGGGR